MENRRLTLSLDNVRLVKRNFSGKSEEMNERGERTCLIVIDAELANSKGFDSVEDMVAALEADEWKVGWFKRENEDGEREAYLPVKAVYGEYKAPNIYIRTGDTSTLLTAETVGSLDYAEIEKTDVILLRHFWQYNGRTGYNNYIQSMEVTVIEDDITARNKKYEIEE